MIFDSYTLEFRRSGPAFLLDYLLETKIRKKLKNERVQLNKKDRMQVMELTLMSIILSNDIFLTLYYFAAINSLALAFSYSLLSF